MSPAAGAAAWLALLIASAVALRAGAHGALAPPPLGSVEELTGWFDDRPPPESAVASVRLLAECTVWYLLARGALLLAAVRRETDARALDNTLPRCLRRLLDVGVGAGMVATTLSPAVDLAGAAEAPATEVVPSGTATMRPVTEPAPTTATARPVHTPSAGQQVAPDDSGTPAAMVEVSVGDSFWVLAEEHLTTAWRRPPTDAEVDPYWRAFIDANRHRLVDPGNPDLLVPGQVLEVPEVPAPPA